MDYAHTEPETVQVKESARTRDVPEKKESARTGRLGRREPHVDDEWAQLARFQVRSKYIGNEAMRTAWKNMYYYSDFFLASK